MAIMEDGKLGPIDGDKERYAYGVAERISEVLTKRPNDGFRIACTFKENAKTEFPNLSDSQQGGCDIDFDFGAFNFLQSGHDNNGAEFIGVLDPYTPSIARLAFTHALLNISSSSRAIRVDNEVSPAQIVISPEM